MSFKNYNPKLEMLICGKIINDGKSFADVSAFVNSKSFSPSSTALIIWKSFIYLDANDTQISLESVTNYLAQRDLISNLYGFGIEGIDGIENATSGIPLLKALSEYSKEEKTEVRSLAKQLLDMNMSIKVDELYSKIGKKIEAGEHPESILAFVEVESGKIFGMSPKVSAKISDSKTAAVRFMERFKDAVAGKGIYIETGLSAIDFVVGGVGEGELLVIAGSSGDGKSTLAHNILRNTSINGDVIAGVISGEMTEFEIIARFIQMETGILAKDIKKGKVPANRAEEFKWAYNKFKDKSKVIFHEFSGLSMSDVRLSMMKMKELGCKYVIVDQANNISLETTTGGYTDTDVKGYMIKAWAGEIGLGVILLHQLNKSVNDVKRKGKFDVSLADLAESGEKPANGVLFVRHDNVKNMIIWAKVRDGDLSLGTNLLIDFNIETMVYSDAKDGMQYIPDGMSKEKQ